MLEAKFYLVSGYYMSICISLKNQTLSTSQGNQQEKGRKINDQSQFTGSSFIFTTQKKKKKGMDLIQPPSDL